MKELRTSYNDCLIFFFGLILFFCLNSLHNSSLWLSFSGCLLLCLVGRLEFKNKFQYLPLM